MKMTTFGKQELRKIINKAITDELPDVAPLRANMVSDRALGNIAKVFTDPSQLIQSNIAVTSPQEYTLGFMFSADLREVLLIRKDHPDWQRRRLNGIGGKSDPSRDTIFEMVREFNEEAVSNGKFLTDKDDWNQFAIIRNEKNTFKLHCFMATSRWRISNYVAADSNREQVFSVDPLNLPQNIVPNCRWLIPLAMTALTVGSPVLNIIEE